MLVSMAVGCDGNKEPSDSTVSTEDPENKEDTAADEDDREESEGDISSDEETTAIEDVSDDMTENETDTAVGECAHSFVDEVIPPSCTVGYTMHTCTLCDYSYSDSYTEAFGHKYTETLSDGPCNEHQVMNYACSECGYKKTESLDAMGTEHSFKRGETVSPTRTEGGYTLYKCSLCNAEERRNETAPVEYSLGLKYEKYNYKWYVSGIGICRDTEIVIPSVNEHGNKVEGIYRSAFENQTQITSVYIPYGVVEIQVHAFSGCTGITRLDIPKGCRLEERALNNMNYLKELSLPLYDSFDELFYVDFTPEYPKKLEALHIKHIEGSNKVIGSCKSLKSLSFDDSITNIPRSFAEGCSSLEEIKLPSSLKTIGDAAFAGTAIREFTVPSVMKSIPDRMFSGCDQLTRVNLHDKVTSIGMMAFYGCSSLSKLDLPSSIQSFDREMVAGTAIAEISIPESMTVIAPYSFVGAKMLSKVNLHSNVVEIGDNAFEGTAIESFTFTENVEAIGENLFRGCMQLKTVTFNSKLSKIEDYTFRNCSSLKSFTVPDTITSIGDYAFLGCTALESITFHDGITEIGAGAFDTCAWLKSVELPKNITVISDAMFYRCESLESVTFAPNTTKIGKYAFDNCISLTEIALPDTLTEIGENAFEYSGLVRIDIPSNATSVGEYAFLGCENLKEAVIESDNIGENAFRSCTGLENVIIGEGVTDIREGTFSECRALRDISFPDSLQSIDYHAFYGCIGFEELTLSEKIVSVNSEAFYGCTGIKTLNLNSDKLENITTFNSITTLNIGENVKTIPKKICKGNIYLSKVNIPEGVESIGENAFSGCSNLSYVNFPSSIKNIGINAFSESALTSVTFSGEGELVIDAAAFYNCKKLVSIDFVNRHAALHGNAFAGCAKLEAVIGADNMLIHDITDFPEHIYTNQNSLLILGSTLVGHDETTVDGVVTIPEGIKYILPRAFARSAVIRSVTFPSTLEQIGDSVFTGCTRLSEVKFAEDAESLKLGAAVFDGCTSLTAITFPDYVTEIPSRTLYNCSALESVGLPSTITSVADDFHNNYVSSSVTTRKLYKIYFDGTQEQWQRLEFSTDNVITQCTISCTDGEIVKILYYYNDQYNSIYYTVDTNLSMTIYASPVPTDNGTSFKSTYLYNHVRELVIADGVTSIRLQDFWQATDIENVVIPPSLRNIDLHFLGNTVWYKNAEFYDENGLFIRHNKLYKVRTDLSGEITLPSGLTEISGQAFYNCKLITSVIIPEGVTYIGSAAFYNCDSLENVTLPSTILELGESAFSNCARLNNVILPEGIEKLGRSVFSNCDSITEIIVPSTVKEYSYVGNSCGALKKMIIRSSADCEDGVAIYSYNIDYVIYEGNITSLPQIIGYESLLLKAVVIPESVTEIVYRAFGKETDTPLCFMSESNAKTITDLANKDISEGEFKYYIYNEHPDEAGNWWYYDAEGDPVVVVIQ